MEGAGSGDHPLEGRPVQGGPFPAYVVGREGQQTVQPHLARSPLAVPAPGTDVHPVPAVPCLVVAILGALSRDEARLCATRTAHGLAMVIDRGGFGRESLEDDPAHASAQELEIGGWRTEVVRPGDDLPRTWERLALARAVGR